MLKTALNKKQNPTHKSLGLARWISVVIICFLSAAFVSVDAQAAATANTYAGTWGGTYAAGQGLTRVVLVLEAVNNTLLKGRFIFYPDNSNPAVPSGQYAISGSVDVASGQLKFHGTQWLIRPVGYVTVGFNGLISLDKKTIKGNVIRDDIQTIIGKFAIGRFTSVPRQ